MARVRKSAGIWATGLPISTWFGSLMLWLSTSLKGFCIPASMPLDSWQALSLWVLKVLLNVAFIMSCHVDALSSSTNMQSTGNRRNLSTWTIAAFVLLASLGSLGYALSLFFITILYTPISEHSDDAALHNALFTPSHLIYDVAIIASIIALNLFPELVADYGDVRVTRLGYLAMPLFFAFAPMVCTIRNSGRYLLTCTRLSRPA